MTEPLVGIIMGSSSDWETMRHAAETLDQLGVAHETKIVSAHDSSKNLRQIAAPRDVPETSLPERFAGASMPEIRAIDLTQDPPPRGRWLAPELVRGIEANLARGEQSLLFLNRRGFAPLTLCRHCGHRFQCPNCTAWMVEHRLMHRLACHH